MFFKCHVGADSQCRQALRQTLPVDRVRPHTELVLQGGLAAHWGLTKAGPCLSAQEVFGGTRRDGTVEEGISKNRFILCRSSTAWFCATTVAGSHLLSRVCLGPPDPAQGSFPLPVSRPSLGGPGESGCRLLRGCGEWEMLCGI